MQYVKHFLKQMIFPLLYAVIMMMINLSIMMIGEHLMWLKYILYALSLGLYAFIIGAVAFKDGQDAVKVRHMNDVERLNIIRTGEDRPLNVVKEYKPWKGFVSGLSVCLPLIILLLTQAICLWSGSTVTWPGALASYIYIIVFSFFRPNSEIVPTTYYFWNLVSIPVYALLLGGAYMLGAKKQMLLYQQVEDKHKAIYGDKN